MLHFFRTHQRYFFAIITVVIVISFSFFGTYSTLAVDSWRDAPAFTAVDGEKISRSELDTLVNFIGTDSDDKLIFGGIFGPNFLNDGVLSKDFVQSGLATKLALAFPQEVEKDLLSRFEKEKRQPLYTHPDAEFISAETAWSYFVPEMGLHYSVLVNADSPVTQDALNARAKLFATEKRFPQSSLKQVLKFQEKQYQWVRPDQNLDYLDLSLFGHHTIEDWYGPRFVRLAAEYILNASKIAEQRGYRVSEGEAIADLLKNSLASYEQNAKNPRIGVANAQDYLDEQLRRMNLDLSSAAKIWKNVMLFRLLANDEKNSVFTDALLPGQYAGYSAETANGSLYELPKPLRLATFEQLQQLETYLNALSGQTGVPSALAKLPQKEISIEEIEKKAPELLQKRYLVDVKSVSKKQLESKITLKQLWAYETDPVNFAAIKKQFPEIGTTKANDSQEISSFLDQLDPKTRSRIDAYARAKIVESHPEWVENALKNASVERTVLTLRLKGDRFPIAGLKDSSELMKKLDSAKEQEWLSFSADQNTFYLFYVIDKSDKLEIASFVEALQSGALDERLNKQLEVYYGELKKSNPADYKVGESGWKNFNDVKQSVAEKYFVNVIEALKKDASSATGQGQNLSADKASSYRFYGYLNEVLNRFKKEGAPSDETLGLYVLAQESHQEAKAALPIKDSLVEQFKLSKVPFSEQLGSTTDRVDVKALFSLKEGEWSGVKSAPNGDLTFLKVEKRSHDTVNKAALDLTLKAQNTLGNEAKNALLLGLLEFMKSKNALSLEFMEVSAPEMAPEVYEES